MARILFLFTVLALAAGQSLAQEERRLTLATVEQLLNVKMEDENLALEIRRKGIAFRATPEVLDRLRKLGAGEKTAQALREKEESAAIEEYAREREPARRLALGRAFVQAFPQSKESPRVAVELDAIELDAFEAEFQAFSAAPDAAGLARLLARGDELLRRRQDAPALLRVSVWRALATGRGMIGNVYSDLDRSRDYANQARKLLESAPAPAGMEARAFAQFRAASLGRIYQSLGLYLIRQPAPDPEQAIAMLTLAAELKDSPGASDPVTYWLRAVARDARLQKLSDGYRALPKPQRNGRPGQALCGEIGTLLNQQILDYTQVISLSSRAEASAGFSIAQLKTQAVDAINALATGERPCASGRGGLVDELPPAANRFAMIVGVEEGLDKQAGGVAHAASDARDVAAALIRYGGFPREQVAVFATGEAADRQPLRSVLLRQLAAWAGRVQDDGLLLVFFAGHAVEQNGKAYLLAADSLTGSDSLLADTALGFDRLKEMIRATGAGQVLLLVDGFRRAPQGEGFARQAGFDLKKNEALAFATLLAASAEQRSAEARGKRHGAFAAALLDAMQGTAAARARGVTLADLIGYLQTAVPREAGVAQTPQALVEGYNAEDLVLFPPARSNATPTPAELLRAARTLRVTASTVYLKEALLEAELRKIPEFQQLNLSLVGEGNEADLILDIRLPFLTWNWNYTVTHRATNTVLLTGKRRGLTDDTVSPDLASELVARLLELRNPGK